MDFCVLLLIEQTTEVYFIIIVFALSAENRKVVIYISNTIKSVERIFYGSGKLTVQIRPRSLH